MRCMGRDIHKGHDNKISRPSASFMINRTQLKFTFDASNKYLMSGKVKPRYIHTSLTFLDSKMG